MKNKVILLMLCVFVFSVLITSVLAITGDTITGEVSAQQLNMNISVVAYFPTLTILSPENKTYLTNESLLLNYRVVNKQAIWYNLDNVQNITITSFLYFNTSQGNHTLNLYANSSFGNVTARNVSFYVNSTMFIILYDNYKGTYHENTTDFYSYAYEDIQNLSNIIIEDTNYGKILFNQPINVTNDANPNDNYIDINNNTNISSNRIELNSTALTNFNVSATLWLYGLTYTNPRILRNGQVCPSSVCVKESYSPGTLKFNVTGFSVYSAEETPVIVETPGPGPGGGGGGGGVVSEISINKKEIKVQLKAGETKKEGITIKNLKNVKIRISITAPAIENFLKISERDFWLEAGETKAISIDVIAREDTAPDLYIGKISIKSEGIEKEVLVAVEVQSQKPLFDIKATIPSQYKVVSPGERVSAEIMIYNLGETGRIDANIGYIVKDSNGKTIVDNEESIAIETQASFIKTIQLPRDIAYGYYLLYIKVSYNGNVASASDDFSVAEKLSAEDRNLIMLVGVIIVIIILLAILYEFMRLRRTIGLMKIDENTLKKEKLIK